MISKPVTLIALFLLLSGMAIAQPNGNFKEWGQVTLTDLKISECSFEKNADALMIYDLADVFYEDEGDFFSGSRFSITTAYYQRYKVFTERGTEQANFRNRYRHENKESITRVKAACYNIEHGQIVKTELAQDDIHFAKVNQYETEVTFTVPGVKKGSVFEVTYERNQYVSYTLPSWYFNSDVPSLNSTLRIGFLDAIDYYVKKQISHKQYEEKGERFVSKIKVQTSGYGSETLTGNTITYTALNLPSIHAEPMMNSRVNYMDHVSFQLKGFHTPLNPSSNIVSSWARFNTFLLDNPRFGHHLSGPGIPGKMIKDLIKNNQLQNAEPVDKAKAIFEFVRKNMNWNGMLGSMAENDNTDTWKVKSGSSAEINLLLLNTLMQEGIVAYPMLVGSRDYGYVYTDYPMLDGFKNVVIVMEQPGDKNLVLDASDKFLPFGLPRYDILNNSGYVMRSADDAYWYKMMNQGNDNEAAYIKAKLENDGLIKGEISTSYNNYSQAIYRRIKALGKQDVINERLKKHIPNATIDAFNDSADEANSMYLQKINFSMQPATDNDGNIYISIPAIYGDGENLFVSNERVTAVDFGYKKKTSTVLQLEIPEGYEIDSLFKTTWLRTPDTTISFLFDAEQIGQTLIMRQKLEYKQSLYPASSYGDFYDFHQKYFKMIQQPVVLRRKL